MVRHKNRYMVIEINPQTDSGIPTLDDLIIRQSSLHHSVLSMVQTLHGDFGVAAITAGFTTKYCNTKTRVAVIRCRHGPHKLVASSLPFIKFIDKRRIHINTIYVGATIKQAFKFLQNYQQKKFDEYCVGLKTDEERTSLKKAIMNLDTAMLRLN